MKAFANRLAAAAALVTPFVAASPVTNCMSSNVCFSIGIPEVAASSGSGNVYIQMTAPTSYSWVGMGTGSRMSGSTMFIIYTDGNGNVTVSPRSGSGHNTPSYDSSINVDLLAGSGVSGSTMTANFVVSNLGIDLTSSSSSWIGAVRSGSQIDSTSTSAGISQHNDNTDWGFDLTQATVTTDSNPYVDSSGDTTTGNTNDSDSSSGSTGSSDSGVVSGSGDSRKTIMYIHAIIASVAFVIIMPFAAVLMPLLGKWYVHAGLQLLAFIMMWIGFGLGIKLANDMGILFQQSHTILGTVVICAMILQPVFGWVHHLHYIKHQGRGAISYVHIWYGRILMALGVVNGGLGLKLALADNGYKIAYAAIAAIMFVVYTVGKIAGNMRKSRASKEIEMQDGPSRDPRRPYNTNDEEDWRRHQVRQHAYHSHDTRYDNGQQGSNRYA